MLLKLSSIVNNSQIKFFFFEVDWLKNDIQSENQEKEKTRMMLFCKNNNNNNKKPNKHN